MIEPTSPPSGGDRTTILVHYYRAMVGRADIWRMRMDTTANWAIGATAAIVSFGLGNREAPHYVVIIAPLLTVAFLMLEARRLTFYHLWQQRVLLLERGFIGPAIGVQPGDGEAVDLSRDLSEHIGRTAPTMPLIKAAARRLRRMYLYIFAVQGVGWLLKLTIHPTPAPSVAEVVARAHIGPLPGALVLATAALAAIALAVIARSLGGLDSRKQARSQ
jgi:uncharacterized membrane protein